MSKVKSQSSQLSSENQSNNIKVEESFLKVEFLSLDENDNNNASDNESVDLNNLKKLNKKPLVLDFSLPKPGEELLNTNKNKFKIKSVNNKADYKILSGEINTMAYEGKIKPTDFNPSK